MSQTATYKKNKIPLTGVDLADLNNDSEAVLSMSMQKEFAQVWTRQRPDNGSKTMCIATVEEVVDTVNALSEEYGSAQILVTGSFRHIGGILTVLEGEGQ